MVTSKLADAEHRENEATANQSGGLASESGSTDGLQPGHPPQKPGARYPVNTAVDGVPFYTPASYPSSGTAFGNKKTPKLFETWKLRDHDFRNRIIVSPMCQYSCPSGTGLATDWHLVHSGQFSIRGAALVITEAAAVLANGRITPEDLGIWGQQHVGPLRRIVDFHHSQGAKAGIQLAHAGRKASTYAPWLTDGLVSKPPVELEGNVTTPLEVGGWKDVWAPSAIPFSDKYPQPVEMTTEDIKNLVDAFVAAAKRADQAGYDVVEIHGAHGYLLHNFVSPLSNKRTDKYGGSLDNRLRLPIETARAVRNAWPASKPLFYRLSASEYYEKGEKGEDGSWISWGLEQSKILAQKLAAEGVDLIDVSSGGNYSAQKIDVRPGYQVDFAKEIRAQAGSDKLLVGSVGLITDPHQAEEILQRGEADVVLLAREFLRNADFVLEAANALDTVISVPAQYQRASTRMYSKLKERL